MHKGSDKSGII